MSDQVKHFYTVEIRMHITVSGSVSVYADVKDETGEVVHSRILPKKCARGDFVLAKKAVVEYNGELAIDNVLSGNPDSLFMGRREPVDLSIFELEGLE